jgi:hypothetical protein
MGDRYLKAEEEVIQTHYPTSRRREILALIPSRTWSEIGVKARKMGIHRTKEAKGDSIREGRMMLKCLKSIFSHARRRYLHRTKEAKARQVQIGREEEKKKNE